MSSMSLCSLIAHSFSLLHSTYILVKGLLPLFDNYVVLSILHNCHVKNMTIVCLFCVHISFKWVGELPKSIMGGPLVKTMFGFVGNCPIVFQSGCTIFCPNQQWLRASPHRHCCHCVLGFFVCLFVFISASLISVQWPLIDIWTCIFLMTNNAVHIFI